MRPQQLFGESASIPTPLRRSPILVARRLAKHRVWSLNVCMRDRKPTPALRLSPNRVMGVIYDLRFTIYDLRTTAIECRLCFHERCPLRFRAFRVFRGSVRRFSHPPSTTRLRISPGSHSANTSNGRQHTSQSVVKRCSSMLVSTVRSNFWPQNGHCMAPETSMSSRLPHGATLTKLD